MVGHFRPPRTTNGSVKCDTCPEAETEERRLTDITHFAQMDFPIHIDTIRMGLCMKYFKGLQVGIYYGKIGKISKVFIFLISNKMLVIHTLTCNTRIANRAAPDQTASEY